MENERLIILPSRVVRSRVVSRTLPALDFLICDRSNLSSHGPHQVMMLVSLDDEVGLRVAIRPINLVVRFADLFFWPSVLLIKR